MRTAVSSWSIGLDGWIIQDGNYHDFRLGDRAEFAVEFHPMTSAREASSTHVGVVDVRDDLYDVVARVAHVDADSWVLDFGLKAYESAPPPSDVSLGMVVRTTLSLGVDPYDYFERLSLDPAYPDLVYTWTVHGIRLNTTPRDESRASYRDVPRTNAWKDQQGEPDYLLDCTLLALPPQRTSVTAR